jgi:hypothetical protein
MNYGKKTIHESYFDGELKSSKIEYSIPILIKDKSQVISEIMTALELINSRQTNNVLINIKADAKTHEIKLITRTYTTD